MGTNHASTQEEVLTETDQREDLEDPKAVKVLLVNDDYSTFEFVVEVLMKFFHKTEAEAELVTLQVHHEGKGVAGIFTPEIAETKAHQVVEYARSKGHPLQAVVES